MFASKEAALEALGRGAGFGLDQVVERMVYKSGADTPSNTSTVPDFIGQHYFDTANNKWYIAKDTTAATDFLIIN